MPETAAGPPIERSTTTGRGTVAGADWCRRAAIGLWLVWAGLLLGGFVLGTAGADASHRIGMVNRLGSSVVLVAAGWLWYVAARGTSAGRPVWLIAAGMTLGAVGDFFNAGVLQDVVPLPDPVLGGIASFGLGHVAYITACVLIARRARLEWRAARNAAVVIWQLIGLVSWYYVVYRGTDAHARLLVWPALPYALLLAGTTGLATALAWCRVNFAPLAIGAALFLASDMVLAYGLFYESFRGSGDVVWLMYGPGQMSIVYSAASVRRVLAELTAASEPQPAG